MGGVIMNLVLNTSSLRCLQDIQRRIVLLTVEFINLEFVGVGWAGEVWELLDNLEKSG